MPAELGYKALGTICVNKDGTAGDKKPLVIPTKTIIAKTGNTPVLRKISASFVLSKNKAIVPNIKNKEAQRIIFRRSNVSATCPEKKEVMIKGIASVKPIKPKAKTFLVKLYTCHPTITLCICMEMVRKKRALIKEPNSGTLKTAYGFTLFRDIIFRKQN